MAIIALLSLYFYAQTGTIALLLTFWGATIGFALLVRAYQKLSHLQQITAALVQINQNEITFLSGKGMPFDNGADQAVDMHQYAYDLDILGKNSLFQFLNRTATYPGKTALANMLLYSLQTPEPILERQKAIQELQPKLDWRQHLQAVAVLKKDTAHTVAQLLRWAAQPAQEIPRWIIAMAWASPLALCGTIAGALLTGNEGLLHIASGLFSINLLLFGLTFKRIQSEISAFDQIHVALRQYGLLVKNIETESFESPLLRGIAAHFKVKNTHASTEITQLSHLFNRLDSIANMVVVLLFDGFALYHIHQLQALQQWKKQYAGHVEGWLSALGEIEALSSLAHFAYNNPAFAYPELNTRHEIHFDDLGHPLIATDKRVCNTVHFGSPHFMVLTGSNMSGKSTFLRSLGVNMVLTGTGAPVCARKATVHPMPILVSMRLSDSLSDSESYFFAEVKRLSEITHFLERERAFVLLDEILRGTNSDDKRMGTVGVLKKMVALKAIGAIATHDIEVCNTTLEYPEALMNNCFEVNILQGAELSFDYRLRDGICQNKSASFLMQKMGIIGQ